MALVDARRRRVDDHEHLGREVLALAVEDHARDVQPARVVGALLAEEVQRREAVLAVDDQVLAARLSRLPTFANLPTGSNPSFSAVKSSTVPGIGGWLTAVS